MLQNGFFSSLEGDRVYSAEDMSTLYEGLFTDGVIRGVGADLKVQLSQEGGMKVSVDTGRAVVGGKWLKNTELYDLAIAEAHTNYHRIDLIVVQANYEERKVDLVVKKGNPAVSPVAPTLENSSAKREIPLARVRVPANATQITDSFIEDYRKYASLDNMKNNATRYISQEAFFAASAKDAVSFAFYQQVGEVVVESMEINDNKIIHVTLHPSVITVPDQSIGYLGVKILMPSQIGYIPENAVVSFIGGKSVHLVGQQVDDLGRRVYVFTSDSTSDNILESVSISFMSLGDAEEISY